MSCYIPSQGVPPPDSTPRGLFVLLCSVYCTILLIGVYVSTCYWNLAPAAETISSSISIASNATLSAASERISACWMDFNGGAILKPRMLVKGASSGNCSLSSPYQAEDLPLEAATKDLAVVRWLDNSIDKISKSFTESLLGIKLTL